MAEPSSVRIPKDVRAEPLVSRVQQEWLRPVRWSVALLFLFLTLGPFIVVPHSGTQGPLTNAVVLNLSPVGRGDLVRGPDNPRINRLPVIPKDASVVLILGSTADQTYPNYRVRCLGRSGARLWPDKPLSRDPSGSFSVILQRQDLPETSWWIEVYGLVAGAERPLEAYRIEPAEGKAP
jgi:hypothetical protein